MSHAPFLLFLSHLSSTTLIFPQALQSKVLLDHPTRPSPMSFSRRDLPSADPSSESFWSIRCFCVTVSFVCGERGRNHVDSLRGTLIHDLDSHQMLRWECIPVTSAQRHLCLEGDTFSVKHRRHQTPTLFDISRTFFFFLQRTHSDWVNEGDVKN